MNQPYSNLQSALSGGGSSVKEDWNADFLSAIAELYPRNMLISFPEKRNVKTRAFLLAL